MVGGTLHQYNHLSPYDGYKLLPAFHRFVLSTVPPVIVSIKNVVSAPEASDARLPCVSKGNPATSQTNWTLDGHNVLLWPRFIVLQKGTLLIRNVKRSDVGSYKCTPINSVGVGISKESKLVVKSKY